MSVTSASSSTTGSAIPQHVLIVGGDGTIGSALNKRLLAEGFQVTCSTRRPGVYGDTSLFLDLQDPDSFLPIKDRRFDAAVLCGAITSIQKCEENPEQTRQVNVDATLALADLLAEAGSHLVFLSTNMVFDGSKPNAQSSDARNPLTEYGRQKAAVEVALLEFNIKASIIRLGKVLPPNFPLFKEWLERMRSGNCIHPHANRTMAPISLAFATDVLAWLIAHKGHGIFQATASHDITYVDAAFMLANLFQSDSSLIEPVNAPLVHATKGSEPPPFGYTALEFSPEFLSFFSPPTPAQALHYAFQQQPR